MNETQLKVKEAYAKVQEAVTELEKLADSLNVPIVMDIFGYGMSGTYYPAGNGDEWWSSDYSGTWVSSSSQC